MKIAWLVALMVILPVVASTRSAHAVEEKDVLNGTWLPLSADLGGQKFPNETLKAMKLILDNEKYTLSIGSVVDRGTCKIDAGKTPKAMDITGTEGPNKGKTFLAIYELKGDSLRICYDLRGKARPAEFVAKAGEIPLFLVTYKREKP